jgi:hypothetical protein
MVLPELRAAMKQLLGLATEGWHPTPEAQAEQADSDRRRRKFMADLRSGSLADRLATDARKARRLLALNG